MLTLIFWKNYLGLLSEQEMRELFYKLSETSKYLYNISKPIKLSASFFRNIYIPSNIPFKNINTTIIRFIEQYDIKSSPNKRTVHIDLSENYEIDELMMILSVFNIALTFYTNSILIHKILNVVDPTRIVKLSFQDAIDIDIEQLSPYLAKMTNLTTFKLQYDEKIKNSMTPCITLITITQLTSLDISDISLKKNGLLLAKVLERMTQLRTLKLCKNKLFITSGMTSSLKNLSQLTTLDICYNRLWPSGAIILASPLSELTNLNYGDLAFVDEGVKIKIKKSKTDQFGEGMIKAIPYFNNEEFCPVINLKKMLKICKINTGRIFRRISKSGKVSLNSLTDQNVALILKKYLKSNKKGVL